MGKTVKKTGRAVKQRGNSAKKPSRGKPFKKGNPYAFQPGQSGNPTGRPKSRTLLESYRAWLGLPMRGDPSRTNADGVAEAMGQRALSGDVAAAKEICDRVEGRPKQTLDVSVEQKQRAIFEASLDMLKQTGLSDEEAARYLTTIYPEANEWVN